MRPYFPIKEERQFIDFYDIVSRMRQIHDDIAVGSKITRLKHVDVSESWKVFKRQEEEEG